MKRVDRLWRPARTKIQLSVLEWKRRQNITKGKIEAKERHHSRLCTSVNISVTLCTMIALHDRGLPLFSAGKHKHRSLAPFRTLSHRLLACDDSSHRRGRSRRRRDLVRANIGELATEVAPIFTDRSGGGIRAVLRATLPRRSFLPLGTNSTIGCGTKTTQARLAGKASAANGGVVSVGERKLFLARRSIGATAAVIAPSLSTPFDARTHQVVHSTSPLTGGEVLASLMFGRGLRDEFLQRWRAARLTDRVLARTALTRSERTSGRCLRNGSRPWGSRGAVVRACRINGGLGRRVDGRTLLVASAECIGGWRRQGDSFPGRRRAVTGR